MKYAAYSDEELAEKAKGGNEEALEVILDRYKPLARSMAQRYFIRGGDRDDVVQEAMIGLFKAVQAFRREQNLPFAALAKTSCEHTIIDAVRRADTKKNSLLNDSVSLENYSPENEVVLEKEAQKSIESVFETWKAILTEDELQIAVLRLEGKTYKTIAETLDTKVKTVDNTLQRIRKKLNRSKNL